MLLFDVCIDGHGCVETSAQTWCFTVLLEIVPMETKYMEAFKLIIIQANELVLIATQFLDSPRVLWLKTGRSSDLHCFLAWSLFSYILFLEACELFVVLDRRYNYVKSWSSWWKYFDLIKCSRPMHSGLMNPNSLDYNLLLLFLTHCVKSVSWTAGTTVGIFQCSLNGQRGFLPLAVKLQWDSRF